MEKKITHHCKMNGDWIGYHGAGSLGFCSPSVSAEHLSNEHVRFCSEESQQ